MDIFGYKAIIIELLGNMNESDKEFLKQILTLLQRHLKRTGRL